MNTIHRSILALTLACGAGGAAAQVRLYEHDNYKGRSFTAERSVRDMASSGFNDKASSAVVRNGRWQVCADARFEGRCVTLGPGRYASLHRMGLGDRVSSVRRVDGARGGEHGGDRGGDGRRPGDHRP